MHVPNAPNACKYIKEKKQPPKATHRWNIVAFGQPTIIQMKKSELRWLTELTI